MWFGSGQPKSRIEEANRHLLALTNRVTELEAKLKVKEGEVKKKEVDFTAVMEDVHVKRQLEIRDLNALIYKQNVRIQQMERDLSHRDSELKILRKRCLMFDEVLRYKATLGKLTITLEQAEQFASLTANARAYASGQKKDPFAVNTDPAPLMIRDVADISNSNGDISLDTDKETIITNGLDSTMTLADLSNKT